MNIPDDVAAKIHELARKLDTVTVYEKIPIIEEMQRLVDEAASARKNGSSASEAASAVAASH